MTGGWVGGKKKDPERSHSESFLSRDRADHGLRAIGEIAPHRGAITSKGISVAIRLNLGGSAANTLVIASCSPLI